jgi:hypothetical protein
LELSVSSRVRTGLSTCSSPTKLRAPIKCFRHPPSFEDLSFETQARAIQAVQPAPQLVEPQGSPQRTVGQRTPVVSRPPRGALSVLIVRAPPTRPSDRRSGALQGPPAGILALERSAPWRPVFAGASDLRGFQSLAREAWGPGPARSGNRRSSGLPGQFLIPCTGRTLGSGAGITKPGHIPTARKPSDVHAVEFSKTAAPRLEGIPPKSCAPRSDGSRAGDEV